MQIRSTGRPATIASFGLGGNDFLLGGLGNNSLNGGTGADNMHGQAGDDLYFVDNVGDTVTELAGAGIDEIRSSISTSLNFGGRLNVENLTLIGAAISGTGNGLGNRIVGNNFNNSLNGLGGNDSLFGLGGNDSCSEGAATIPSMAAPVPTTCKDRPVMIIYVVDNVGDIVTELAGAGIDDDPKLHQHQPELRWKAQRREPDIDRCCDQRDWQRVGEQNCRQQLQQ